MAKRFVLTVTIPLPDDYFEQVGQMANVREAVEAFRQALLDTLPGEGAFQITTDLSTVRVERGPRKRKEAKAPATVGVAKNGMEDSSAAD
jgi:hypothetical protein